MCDPERATTQGSPLQSSFSLDRIKITPFKNNKCEGQDMSYPS